MQQLFTFGTNDALLAELIAQQVRFLVIGGLAVKFYAAQREADDLDLLIEQTPKNAERLFKAFRHLRLIPQFSSEVIATPGYRAQHLPLKDVYYADLITRPDIEFCSEWERALEALIWQNRVRVASRELLLALKSNSEREKDITDVALLNAI